MTTFHFHRRRCGLALGIALLTLAPLRAETVLNVPTAPEANATIRFIVPWTQTPRFGFAPVRVSIENRAAGERTWHVQFQAGMHGMFPGVLTTEQSVSVPGGQTRDVWVFVPVAEPGTNTTGPGTMPFSPGIVMAPPVVKVTPTPNGKKVSATRVLPGGGSYVREEEIDLKTGTITGTTTTTTGRGTTSTTVNPPRTTLMRPGMAVTFTIDLGTGFIGTRTRLITGSSAPPTVTVVEKAPTPAAPPGGAAGAPTVPVTTPPGPMMLMAEVSGPGVSSGRTTFPGSSSTNGMRPYAVSTALEPVLRGKLSTLVSGAPNLSVVDVSQLPADWRMWSSFSGVVLAVDEYAGLDAARRAALHSWVALGGQLYLSPSAKTTAPENDLPGSTEKLGAGTIVTFSEPLEEIVLTGFPLLRAAPAAGLNIAEVARLANWQLEIAARRAARGMPAAPVETAAPVAVAPAKTGEAAPPGATAPEHAGKALAAGRDDLPLFAGTTGLPDRSALTLDSGPLFEAVKDDSVDNAWLAIFLVGFAVVVGPVNLFLFAPAQKRYRLFVTTPLIALAASVALGVVILVQDGIGGAGARRAFVVLLPGENEAAVFQEQAARTGFLTRRSFALPDDVAAAVLPLEASIPFGAPNVDFDRGNGRAGGDWFQSRGRQAQQLRRIVPTRARVEMVGVAPNGAPIVQSSLGTTLRRFAFIDAKGRGWRAADVPSGQRVTLQLGFAEAPLSVVSGGTPSFRAIVSIAGTLSPSRWSALGGATELAPIATLTAIRWGESDVVYTGTMENETTVLPAKASGSPGGAL